MLNLNTQPLSIIIGQSAPYEKTNRTSYGGLIRLISVGIKNNTKNYLCNCTLYLDHTRSDGASGTIRLAVNSDLPPFKEKYIEVASYVEMDMAGLDADGINLCMIDSTAFGYESLSIEKPHTITLRVEDAENYMVKVDCILWVENGKLCLKNTTESQTSESEQVEIVSSQVQDIPSTVKKNAVVNWNSQIQSQARLRWTPAYNEVQTLKDAGLSKEHAIKKLFDDKHASVQGLTELANYKRSYINAENKFFR